MKKTNLIFSLIVSTAVLLCIWSPVLLSETNTLMATGDSPLYPIKISVKPTIDGTLDEEVWKSQPLDKDFITYKPRFGENLPFKTSVWMAYDNQNLYFAFSCFDPEPQKIKAVITQRDFVPDKDDYSDDDWVAVSIDSQGVGQFTFDFFVTPLNIQVDDIYDVDKGEDFKRDFTWQSGVQRTEKGYQVEIGIPLKTISYKPGKEVKMKILFWRRIARLPLWGSWPAWENTKNISNFWPVIYKDLEDSSPVSENVH